MQGIHFGKRKHSLNVLVINIVNLSLKCFGFSSYGFDGTHSERHYKEMPTFTAEPGWGFASSSNP